jgi:hypothetical protein
LPNKGLLLHLIWGVHSRFLAGIQNARYAWPNEWCTTLKMVFSRPKTAGVLAQIMDDLYLFLGVHSPVVKGEMHRVDSLCGCVESLQCRGVCGGGAQRLGGLAGG